MNIFDTLDDVGVVSKKVARRLGLAAIVAALFVPKVWGWLFHQAAAREQNAAAPVVAAYEKATTSMLTKSTQPTRR